MLHKYMCVKEKKRNKSAFQSIKAVVDFLRKHTEGLIGLDVGIIFDSAALSSVKYTVSRFINLV